MKKNHLRPALLATLSLLLALALLCGCTAAPAAAADPLKDLALTDIMDSILADVPDLPGVQSTQLTAESFPYTAFIDMPEGGEGLVSEAMISAIAHSTVLVRFADEESAKAGETAITENANPRKWICVEAEKTIVQRSGCVVLLVMSSTATADAIAANFTALTEAGK